MWCVHSECRVGYFVKEFTSLSTMSDQENPVRSTKLEEIEWERSQRKARRCINNGFRITSGLVEHDAANKAGLIARPAIGLGDGVTARGPDLSTGTPETRSQDSSRICHEIIPHPDDVTEIENKMDVTVRATACYWFAGPSPVENQSQKYSTLAAWSFWMADNTFWFRGSISCFYLCSVCNFLYYRYSLIASNLLYSLYMTFDSVCFFRLKYRLTSTAFIPNESSFNPNCYLIFSMEL